jgi:hypothetical protein
VIRSPATSGRAAPDMRKSPLRFATHGTASPGLGAHPRPGHLFAQKMACGETRPGSGQGTTSPLAGKLRTLASHVEKQPLSELALSLSKGLRNDTLGKARLHTSRETPNAGVSVEERPFQVSGPRNGTWHQRGLQPRDRLWCVNGLFPACPGLGKGTSSTRAAKPPKMSPRF